MSHHDPPRTDGVRRVGDRTLRALRGHFRRGFSRRWDVRVHGLERVPTGQPHVVAANHIGLMDGPLLVACHPLPVHALTKREMFAGHTGRALRAVGQVPLDREHADPAAIKACLRVLRDGGVVGVFPEGLRGGGELVHVRAGMAYLALVTGAPVVPLVFFGSREPGGEMDSVPPPGTRIDLVYGDPIPVSPVGFPRRQEQIRATTAFLHERLRRHLVAAQELTGRELPGPLPVSPRYGLSAAPPVHPSSKEVR